MISLILIYFDGSFLLKLNIVIVEGGEQIVLICKKVLSLM